MNAPAANGTMNSSDLFLNLMLQQQDCSSAASTPLATPPVDHWLTDAQLLPMMPDFLKQAATQPKVEDLFDAYLSSPEIMTPAMMGSSSSVASASPVSHASPSSPLNKTAADITLFPEISPQQQQQQQAAAAAPVAVAAPAAAKKPVVPAPPAYRSIAPAKKPLVPIMPKSAAAARSSSISSPGSSSPASPQPAASGFMMPTMAMPSMQGLAGKRKSYDSKESEEVILKRQKNTDAARRSRLKKLVKMEALEKRVVDLETDNAKLSTKIAVLESQKSVLESKDKGLEERIRTLEAQLAEAHKALTGRQ
ncbi:hypothetical protein BC940DRAFT_337504 [Gongronella butleri]|nr:hypothetical protein BC940DRAFT_337504 [Gongronella butleri]